MSYQNVRKSKECTFIVLRGSYEDNCAKFVSYSHNLAITNIDMILCIKIDNDNRFKHIFISLRLCICILHSSMQNIIIVNETFLIEKDKCKMIIATCPNANIQIYPLGV